MELDQEVLIVGSGIAGLATALALKQIGIQSLVLERSVTLRTTGAALTLANNARISLNALGIAVKLSSSYISLHKNIITDAVRGITHHTRLLYLPNERIKFGAHAVHRRTLRETIAEELPADTICFLSKLRSIETVRNKGSTTAILSSEDGTVIKAKVIHDWCDGVHSVVAHHPSTFLDVIHHFDLSILSWAPLMFRVPWDLLLSDMYKDDLTVAGVAMHRMTPDLGQSHEDAIVLARHVGNSYALNGKTDSNGLKGYVDDRRWHCYVYSSFYFSGWVQQRGSGWLKDLEYSVLQLW